jgi:hypothetical protein
MRWSRFLLASICTALLVPLAPAAHAAGNVQAIVVTPVISTDGIGASRVVVNCLGLGDQDALLISMTCDMYDSSGAPSIHHQRNFPGPAGHCVINAFNMQLPVEVCATATATFKDLSTKTSTACYTSGSPAPPHTAPSPHTPGFLECEDPLGIGI